MLDRLKNINNFKNINTKYDQTKLSNYNEDILKADDPNFEFNQE